MDEFANLPDDDEFGSLPDDNNIQKPESFLKKALRSSPTFGGYMDIKDPADLAQKAIGGLGGFIKSQAVGSGYDVGHQIKTQAIENLIPNDKFSSTALDIATDIPEMIITGIAGRESIGKLGGVLKKSEEAKEGVRANLFKRMTGRRKAMVRSYGSALKKSKAKVDLTGVLEESGSPIKVDMAQAQDIKNQITSSMPENIKSGIKFSSKYSTPGEIAEDITQRMIAADPEIAPVIQKYGEGAEAFKTSIGQFTPSATGSEKIYGKPGVLGIRDPFLGGTGGRVATKKFAPKVFKIARSERTKENWRRIGEASAIGIPLSMIGQRLVPNVFKQIYRRTAEGL